MAQRALLAALALAAVVVGFLIPGPHHRTAADPKSQIDILEVARR